MPPFSSLLFATHNPHNVDVKIPNQMDSDKPPPPSHRTGCTSSTAGDLFICFTSMKISSKSSILSPNRPNNRDPPISLTTSLSRRLRTNRSIKGGASPAMFPTTGKKRTSGGGGGGGGFDVPEPSSPKVTCIGQVRVKSKKKKGKKLRSLSRRHSSAGDVSFRKLERSRNSFGSNHENFTNQRNNQRWVHLPLTICEALRAFGSEFSCLFPCRKSCFSPATERESKDKTGEGVRQGSGSCAAVFTRWLVAFQDGDDGGRGGRRDIELVVGDEDEIEDEIEEIRVSRRHVFDDLEIVNDRIRGNKDESRLSICIPPKNALLLMRCRSDPLKMEALTNRLCDPMICQNDEIDDEFVYYEDEFQDKSFDSVEFHEIEANQETNLKQSIETDGEIEEKEEQILEINQEKEEEITFFGSLFEEIDEIYEEIDEMEDASEVFGDPEMETEESNIEKVKVFEKSKEREDEVLEREGLPECLLLMMCEPKLSMEVSKETWVSSKDFIRRQSSRKKPPPPPALVKPINGQDESKVSVTTTTTFTNATKYDKCTVARVHPGRSSCSLPAPPSMAEMIEQKLVNAVGYEPFVLTRCKSEPMRTAAAKLAPDSCYWKNRKLEPLRRASFGVGAAGVGF